MISTIRAAADGTSRRSRAIDEAEDECEDPGPVENPRALSQVRKSAYSIVLALLKAFFSSCSLVRGADSPAAIFASATVLYFPAFRPAKIVGDSFLKPS